MLDNINDLQNINVVTVRKVVYNGTIRALKLLNRNFISNNNIHKEVAIHKSLCHRFIVKYITHFESNSNTSLIMEFIEYNLRSFIVPEVGLDSHIAHLILAQLISSVKYLHSVGICHRDIKPDNILIDSRGNIRLSDFGHSTLFRHKEYRRLKSVAGTLEFMAPEVLKGDYNGPLADIFSIGITLLNMLTGKLPWAYASGKDEKYTVYRQLQHHCYDPFSRLREPVLRLIERMLREEDRRISLEEVENDKWVNQTNTILGENLECIDPSFLDNGSKRITDLHFTQPEVLNAKKCFLNTSQPVQPPHLPILHRFYIGANIKTSIETVCEVLEGMAVMLQRNSNAILFSTTDSKRNKLVGEIVIQELNGNSIVTIKRTKGDLLEFKKFLSCVNSQFST
ncbi:Serine/threonine-protein kinase Chk1 [Glugoides intestinalis]